MEISLSTAELENALKFEGYGRKSAPYWFIGIEEGGGSMEQLRTRAKYFDPVEDLHASQVKLGFPNMYRHVPVWRIISKLFLALEGVHGWRNTSNAREYAATKLGRADGDTFLTDLMPLPSPSTAVWPYETIFPTRDDYYAAVRPRRIKWLRSELAEYRARYVICYGKGNWDRYEGIFPDVEFKPELDNHIRAGYVGDCTILSLPFFSYYYVTVELIGQIANMFGQVNKKGP